MSLSIGVFRNLIDQTSSASANIDDWPWSFSLSD